MLDSTAESGKRQHIHETLKNDHWRVFLVKVSGYPLGSLGVLLDAVAHLHTAFVVLVGQRVDVRAIVWLLIRVPGFLKELLGNLDIDATLVEVGVQSPGL